MAGTDLGTRSEEKIDKPRKFSVRFHDDDFTPAEFVIEVLMRIFKMSHDEAVAMTMSIHKTGSGRHGPYPLEIAETRATLTMDWARSYGLPFKCTVEAD